MENFTSDVHDNASNNATKKMKMVLPKNPKTKGKSY